MRKADYPDEVIDLINHLKKLPGIGRRSAERIAIALLNRPSEPVFAFSDALRKAASEIEPCEECGFFRSKSAACPVCSDPERDRTLICVVEQPTDVIPLEKTGAFRGLYHVLGGRLAPLDNIHPEHLRIAGLEKRLAASEVSEVILALGADVEGEATARYLTEMLRGFPEIKVTGLAQGLPAGSGLEHADELTLFRALSGRRSL